ncbi:MAG: hypothetical protein CMO71_00955 [Verrucomicrobiales bacterium]|nr:hypothetical protein [Verrucomicrobiales bacterium]
MNTSRKIAVPILEKMDQHLPSKQ